MKDIHSHILPGIDDGARNVEESIKLLEKFYDNGVTDIILTPHYIYNSNYNSNNKEKMLLLNEVKKKYKKVNLYLGNEVYISDNIPELIKQNEIFTLNNSKYLLIELPMNSEIKNLDSIIFDIMRNGIIPIIAHPERYSFVQKEPELINDLIDKAENPEGTAKDMKINGITIAGKTGTAELKSSKDEKADTIGWFDCFTVNTTNPYLFVGMVEKANNNGGSHYLIPMIKNAISK